MITLVLILTYLCPDGAIKENRLTYKHPEQSVKAVEDHNRFKDLIGEHQVYIQKTKQSCTLDDVKGYHKRNK